MRRRARRSSRRPTGGLALALAGLGALTAGGCADGPAARFEREAAPVLEGRCATAACHGVAADAPWPGEGFFLRLDAEGRIADLAAAREAARARVSVRTPRASSLLRVPLPRWAGGGPHAGGASFTGPDDPALEALRSWVLREAEGGEDLALSPLELQFRDEVAPVLVARCARGGCHGPSDVAFTAFPLHGVSPPHDVALEGQVSDVDARAGRRVVRKLLDLAGADPRRSRLFRKAVGEHDPEGLVHRGGRSRFFPEAGDDPFESADLQAILRWARAEREALGVADGAAPRGIVYVDAPPAPRAPYRIEPGVLGGDVFLAGWPEPGTPENLTAALHPEGPIELMGLAVSHDATRVAFAMRRADEARFALYELDLETRALRRATAPEAAGSFVQPAYLSDGRLVAAWDGHGEAAADADGIAPELIAVAADGSLERLTFTPAPEVAPGMLAAGKTRGMLVFGTRREGERGAEGVLFRFPLCHDPALHGEPEYHVQHGASLWPRAPLVARDLLDGRQVVVALSSALAADDHGALAVIDRALGPDLGAREAESSLGGYRRPISWLDERSVYRDPAPLPDGRVLVSIDAGDGEDALHVLTLADGPEGATIVEQVVLLSRAGRSLRSALPLFPRPPEDDGHEPLTDARVGEGFLVLRDVAVLESLFGRAEPAGARPRREDIVGLRLLAAAGARAEEVRWHDDGGTTVGLARRVPARILGEVALPADRSAYLQIPARTPVLLQLLDADGMEVGRSLDRWYYAEGAEEVPGGTSPPTYDHACAGCHGAVSGSPAEAAAPEPDAISAASVTLASHTLRDRRRPRAPTVLEAAAAEEVDFARALRPLISASCIDGCHDADASLPLSEGPGRRFPAAYEALVARIDRQTLRARRSALIERLAGRELEATADQTGVCPPSGSDPALVRAFARWIEAGAFYDLRAREGSDAP